MALDAIKNYVEDKGYLPGVNFDDKERHILTLLEAEETTIPDKQTGEEKQVVEITVEEDGEKKSFITGAVSLLSKLSGLKKGEKIAVKKVSRQVETDEGKQWRTSYEVNKIKDKKVGNKNKEGGATTITEDDVPPEFE